jgi:RimJ/RimL family protein N-acetyltransferase
MKDRKNDKKYMFYILKSECMKHNETTLSEGYSFEIWKPKICKLIPNVPVKWPFFIWSVLHYLRLFKNSNYGVSIVYQDGKIVHYCAILPKFFRTTFMSKNDLEIGPCWTHVEHRRKGIATYAIQKALETYKEHDCRFWYIVGEDNHASRQLAEKLGFTLYGKGVKKKRFWSRIIGTFVIEEKYS